MGKTMNLGAGVRAQRKTLITVAEWQGAAYDVYTLLTAEPAQFDPTEYYKKNAQGQFVAGTVSDEWAANTWYAKSSSTQYREILGARTEDSSIEFNPDIQTSTDILGKTYTDVNKTEPQQTFDPFYLLGGSALGEYLTNAALENKIDNYNGVFTLYIIAAFISETTGTPAATTYKAVKHTGCSIIPTAIGGDSYTNMPIEVHYSNDIIVGSVDKLSDDFAFTPDTPAT